jgi:hypothetical protein
MIIPDAFLVFVGFQSIRRGLTSAFDLRPSLGMANSPFPRSLQFYAFHWFIIRTAVGITAMPMTTGRMNAVTGIESLAGSA